MDKIFIFILFLGPLVFFHELGHYLFARLFGVRVETFSLGFGPKLFKYLKGGTEFTISIIPLGGYVKMFGDDPRKKDEIAPEDRKMSFIHQTKWARFWIVLGGPLANFILAYFIFFSLLVSGEKIPEFKLGVIPSDSVLYESGFRTGDVLKKINDRDVYNPTDLTVDDGAALRNIEVFRNEGPLQINLKMTGKELLEQLLKYPPFLRKPIISNKNGETFYLSLSKQVPEKEISFDEMAELGGEKEFFLLKETGNNKYKLSEPIILKTGSHNEFIEDLNQKGFYPSDLVVRSVKMNSPADKSGIKANDIIYSLDGKQILSFEDLRNGLQESNKKEIALNLWRENKKLDFVLTPDISEQDGKEVKLIGVFSGGDFIPLKFIHIEGLGIFKSLGVAFTRTIDSVVKIVDGFKQLFSAKMAFKNLGGPLSIGKVASDSFNTSLSYFFQLMALISINLGIINLFPIPVLDGGHIMFIFLEIMNRGPLSDKKMEIAQQLGLSLLLMLMVGAIFNDFSRFF